MLFKKLKKYIHKLNNKIKNDKYIKIIRLSGFFDSRWYLREYPDIINYNGSPLQHYIQHGANEGRASGPYFDTQAYLNTNSNILKSGINPLVHYILHGARNIKGIPQAYDNKNLDIFRSKIQSFSLVIMEGEFKDFKLTIKSLSKLKSYNFELLLDSNLSKYGDFVDKTLVKKNNINAKNVSHSKNYKFIDNSVKMSKCDFIIFLNPGDMLGANSLYKLSHFLSDGSIDVVYSSEGGRFSTHHILSIPNKPNWSPELLKSFNYFDHITAIRRTTLISVLNSATNRNLELGIHASEWDLNLRVAEYTNRIERYPGVLSYKLSKKVTNRRPELSLDQDSSSVLESFWNRKGRQATILRPNNREFEAFQIIRQCDFISIIIVAHKEPYFIAKLVLDIVNKSLYINFHILILTKYEPVELFTKHLGAEVLKQVKIIQYSSDFSDFQARNFGASITSSDLLLFLDENVEIVGDDWLSKLAAQAIEEGIGVVGPCLLNGTTNKRDPIITIDSIFEKNNTKNKSLDVTAAPILFSYSINCSAVSGLCQLVRRNLFDLVEGYHEEFKYKFADIVLCLNIAGMGFRTVYCAESSLKYIDEYVEERAEHQIDLNRFAKVLRVYGIPEDRYFNYPLSDEFNGSLLDAKFYKSISSFTQKEIEFHAGNVDWPLDLRDHGAIATAAKVPWGTVIWRFDPIHMHPGVEAGARILLEFLLRRKDLRKRFPTPIRDGAFGGFATWVKSRGLSLLGLDESYALSIDSVFSSNIGLSSLQILIQDENLRLKQPLFLLAAGRNDSLSVLIQAASNGQVTYEDIWWFMLKNSESPQRALCETWAVTPSWQLEVPDGCTVFGIENLVKWVVKNYNINDKNLYTQEYHISISDSAQVRIAYSTRLDWRNRFPNAMTDRSEAESLLDYIKTRASGLSALPRAWVEERRYGPLASNIVQPGINILAHFSYPSGLRISAESIVASLRSNDVEFSLRDVPVSGLGSEPISSKFRGTEVYDITLIHVQPEPHFDDVYERSHLLSKNHGLYKIGYWYWEFEEIPASWDKAAIQCDEIWTGSEFIASGLRKRYRQPVRVLSPGIEINNFEPKPRHEFGFRNEEFIFLFIFNMQSVMERKNPFGLIKAFKKNFENEANVKLVIKTSSGHHNPEALRLLYEESIGSNIEIIDKLYDRDKTLNLIYSCDCYVSLHRSEGLGLTMAEAMLFGRPVIATRYSGNLDFMDDSNSLLVDCDLFEIKHDIPPYLSGQVWAEPSIDHAAELMKKIYNEPDLRKKLGIASKYRIQSVYNYRKTGSEMLKRIKEIQLL